SHQIKRASFYDGGHIQGACGYLRTDGSRRLHHGDSVHGEPVLYRYTYGQTDLFFGRRSRHGATRDRSDPASNTEPASSRIGLQRYEPYAIGRVGGEDS